MELKIFFFLAILVSLYDVINCDVINVKNVREIWGTPFKFWLCPCLWLGQGVDIFFLNIQGLKIVKTRNFLESSDLITLLKVYKYVV